MVIRYRTAASQVIPFAVVGDSHIGYGSSAAIFRNVLQKAVGSGNKSFVIFGGDNAHAGADHGQFAQARYTEFKNIARGILGSKKVPYRASIGNWETSTRTLFAGSLNRVSGQMDFPGTQGKVKYVWLDNAPGQFSSASLSLLRNLNPNFFYIIDFHWPLRVKGFAAPAGHVLTQSETDKFFNTIPAAARNKIIAIFTHHAHTFFHKYTNVYPNFPKTKFFVCGCSGAYRCTTGGRGYYEASITIQSNQAVVNARQVNA
jgi:hypothetical protein